MTSDKQAPSPLDYLGCFSEAVSLEKRNAGAGASKFSKDVLNRVVAEYNKLCTNVKHKVDSHKKKLISNMLLG